MVDVPLYLSEDEIGKRVLGRRAHQWPLIAKVLERESGLPPVNPVIGMRYWRAVEAWFDRYEHVEKVISNPNLHYYKPKELPIPPGRGRRPGQLAPGEKPIETARGRRQREKQAAIAKKIEVKPVDRTPES